jgi:hypothetical protein
MGLPDVSLTPDSLSCGNTHSAAALGGADVFAKAAVYRFDGTLAIRNGSTLFGVSEAPPAHPGESVREEGDALPYSGPGRALLSRSFFPHLHATK